MKLLSFSSTKNAIKYITLYIKRINFNSSIYNKLIITPYYLVLDLPYLRETLFIRVHTIQCFPQVYYYETYRRNENSQMTLSPWFPNCNWRHPRSPQQIYMSSVGYFKFKESTAIANICGYHYLRSSKHCTQYSLNLVHSFNIQLPYMPFNDVLSLGS